MMFKSGDRVRHIQTKTEDRVIGVFLTPTKVCDRPKRVYQLERNFGYSAGFYFDEGLLEAVE